MRSILKTLILLWAVVSPSVGAAQIRDSQPTRAQLFSTQEVMEFTLEAPFEQLFAQARQQPEFSVVGSLKYGPADHQAVIDGIQISTRGNTSLQETECEYPKLKLRFGDTSRLVGSPFAGISGVKIGTHCGERADDDFTAGFGRLANEKAVQREAFVYRLLNALEIPTLLA